MGQPRRPAWVEELKSHYLSGSSSFFILHGNVDDVIGLEENNAFSARTISDYLAGRLFGNYDLVLHYDLGRGLRPHVGRDQMRLNRMNELIGRIMGGLEDIPRDPTGVLRILDRLVTLLLVSGSRKKALKTVLIFDYGEFICPPGERHAEHLATFLNWARSPVVKRINLAFFLMTGALSGLHPSLVASGYTSKIYLPMPDLDQRQEFIAGRFPELSAESFKWARLTAGLTLTNIENMMRLLSRLEQQARNPVTEDPQRDEMELDLEGSGTTVPPDGLPVIGDLKNGRPESPDLLPKKGKALSAGDETLARIKKHLIESQCPGLIEFVEPHLNLDFVAGHAAAKKRLAEDAWLIRGGRLEAVPMGYLICGPVGVGKTFIAMCYAGTVGIPCVTLRNFRSKYVGETEANLEKILRVLRELGPVAVIIDEADAAVGDRGSTGDSGTSSRVFAQLAGQMGDTEYRGRIIWFMLTCRPDLLPIDLKRQGRCEEHIPLFYPDNPDELREMFMAMAKKLNLSINPELLPDLNNLPSLSGADIESLLTRVHRESLLLKKEIDRDLIKKALRDFRSTRSPEHELQFLAGIMECSDLNYLPPQIRREVEAENGMQNIINRFRELEIRLA